jgi:hypothetical protein
VNNLCGFGEKDIGFRVRAQICPQMLLLLLCKMEVVDCKGGSAFEQYDSHCVRQEKVNVVALDSPSG